MKHGSLFSGIGGFDLASEWMGWENVFNCEIESFPRKILHHYWPNAISYEDIKKTDFTVHKGRIDIITGGFPCQPYSMAGKRKGKEDEHHLWPEMLRAIREIQPRWVVGENVFGLINWNGGLVFDEVQSDLEAEGYEVQAYVLPAAAVNAPHRRDRVWFVAYCNGTEQRNDIREKFGEEGEIWTGKEGDVFRELCRDGITTDSDNGSGLRNTVQTRRTEFEELHDLPSNATDSDSTNSKTWTQREVLGQSDREKTNGYSNVECRNKWQNFPTQSPICGGNDGIPDRLDDITFPKWRNESIKGYGNAIVPQVVYQIFKAIVS